MEQRLGSSSEDVLKKPLVGGRNLSTEERMNIDLSSKIPGWGVDLDPSLRPGVPRDQARLIGPDQLYPSFEQQIPPHLIHKSTEHAKLTPVFGTSCPPRGLSGVIRNYAYKLSEGRVPHWLLLMTADRIDMVEGILEDFAHFRVPNIPKEMGLKAELKYNKKGIAKKLIVLGGLTFAGIAIARAIRNRRQIEPQFD